MTAPGYTGAITIPPLPQTRAPESSARRVPQLIRRFYFAWNNPVNLLLYSALPILFFSIFGLGQSYSQINMGRGTVSAMIMVNMAMYGMTFMVAAATSVVGTEVASGWMRQVALTPLKLRAYNLARLVSEVLTAIVIGVIVYAYGFAFGVRMQAVAAAQTFLILLASVVIGALFGLFCGLIVRSDAAQGLVGGLSSLIAFASGIFVPLDQMGKLFQAIAPWTPLWGCGKLVEAALRGWPQNVLWPVVNLVAWVVIFAALVALAQRRSARR